MLCNLKSKHSKTLKRNRFGTILQIVGKFQLELLFSPPFLHTLRDVAQYFTNYESVIRILLYCLCYHSVIENVCYYVFITTSENSKSKRSWLKKRGRPRLWKVVWYLREYLLAAVVESVCQCILRQVSGKPDSIFRRIRFAATREGRYITHGH